MSRNKTDDLYKVALESANKYLELVKINNNSSNINQTDDFYIYYTLSKLALESASYYIDTYDNSEAARYLYLAKQSHERKDFDNAILCINTIMEFNNTESTMYIM